MGEMPPYFLQSLKEVLKSCDDIFLSHSNLRHFFSDPRLLPWQEELPEIADPDQLIEYTIGYLRTRENAQCENALSLLVQVLLETYPVDDIRHISLRTIRNQLDTMTIYAFREETFQFTVEANPNHDPMQDIAEIVSINRCSLSVALITVPYRKGKREYSGTGTGWLIAPGLIITCWHVVAQQMFGDQTSLTSADLQRQIQHMLVSFRHTGHIKSVEYRVLRLEYPLITTVNEQDFVLLRLEDRDTYPYRHFNYLPIEVDTPFTSQTQLSIIQHPQGQTQKMAQGRYSSDSPYTIGRILYTTATDNGTSGAPVFNRRNWRVVALHNGENKAVRLREGTRIQYIMEELQAKKPELFREINDAQTDLGCFISEDKLLYNFHQHSRPIDTTLHTSFSVSLPQKQDAVTRSTSRNETVPQQSELPRSEYTHISTWNNSSPISCLVFDATGQYLVSCDSTNTIKMWNTHSGIIKYMLEGDRASISCLNFSPDGQYLVSGDDDGTIIIWNVSNRKRKKTFQAHRDTITKLIFSPDGRYLLSGSHDGWIKFWDFPYGTFSHQVQESAEVLSFAFLAQKQLITSCVSGGEVRITTPSQQKLPRLATPLPAVRDLALSRDNIYLALGNSAGVIALYETVENTIWKKICSMDQHASQVRCLVFHPEGNLLASGGDDRVIQLWAIPDGRNIQTLVKHTGQITSLVFSRDGQFLASGGKDARIICWKHK